MNPLLRKSLLAMALVQIILTTASLQASETDDRIVSAAKKSYVFKTYLKDDSIQTQSKDGVVTLTGTVAEEFHKSLAQDTVAGLPGVKSVDNQLRINAEPPPAHSDSWLAAKVRTALLFHRNVSATKTDVEVKDGVVTLRGEAASDAQKELTAEYARDVDGIKDVKNQMTVSTATEAPGKTIGERIDDASITAEVKMALATHRSTSVFKTRVETVNGVVTLTGAAKNAAEKDLVTKLASDIKGVKKVLNNMSIGAVVTGS
jgi:osmotically-inducible protein OsmY